MGWAILDLVWPIINSALPKLNRTFPVINLEVLRLVQLPRLNLTFLEFNLGCQNCILYFLHLVYKDLGVQFMYLIQYWQLVFIA